MADASIALVASQSVALLLSDKSTFSHDATDASSSEPDPASSSSTTPPTSVSDNASQSSEPAKLANINVAPGTPPACPILDEPDHHEELAGREPTPLAPALEPTLEPMTLSPASSRPQRRRTIQSYNITKLAAASRARRGDGADATQPSNRRRTLPSRALGSLADASGPDTPAGVRLSPRKSKSSSIRSRVQEPPSRRASSRVAGLEPTPFLQPALGKRKRESAGPVLTRELRRLQDTNEFSGIETAPVVHTVWARGKLVVPENPRSAAARKRAKLEAASEQQKSDEAKTEEADPTAEPVTTIKKKRVKKYLEKGLYAGQEIPSDPAWGLTTAEKKRLAQIPELRRRPDSVHKTLPPPIFNGLRLLLKGRDFKLPFDICNPLPPGQPKPDEWRKMTRNRFIGDSKDYWRKTPQHGDLQSKCVCTREDGCGESCQNRIMLYECDATNCNVGKEHCTNRAFADLMDRKNAGGKYRVGVEVIKTSDRGYGVRSNRCFEPNQVIMEYTGEIITEEECDRRMNEEYKNNSSYYLMSFDQNMIIDATTGSIARFVNHSCNPNCRMIKWIVGGNPRMALFAGDRPIMTGEELTYDYKFDPFSAKNVQKCLCGEPNCRGVLGPKPREAKPTKAEAKEPATKSLKRKGQGSSGNSANGAAKKQKLNSGKGVKGVKGVKVKGVKGGRGVKGDKSTPKAKSLAGGAARVGAGAKKTSVSAARPAKGVGNTKGVKVATSKPKVVIKRVGAVAPKKRPAKATRPAKQSATTATSTSAVITTKSANAKANKVARGVETMTRATETTFNPTSDGYAVAKTKLAVKFISRGAARESSKSKINPTTSGGKPGGGAVIKLTTKVAKRPVTKSVSKGQAGAVGGPKKMQGKMQSVYGNSNPKGKSPGKRGMPQALRTYGKGPKQTQATGVVASATIIAAGGDENANPVSPSPISSRGRVRKLTEKAVSPLPRRVVTPTDVVMVDADTPGPL